MRSLSALSRQEKVETVREKREEVINMMACRSAIKANQPLEIDQIKKLLFDLERTEMPYTCPHGRPISLLFPMDDILKNVSEKINGSGIAPAIQGGALFLPQCPG